jgi:hypothetical protein
VQTTPSLTPPLVAFDDADDADRDRETRARRAMRAALGRRTGGAEARAGMARNTIH